MSDKIFVDSNIFLYTLDQNNTSRRDRSKALLLQASRESRIFLSTQILNEVYSVATRKLGVEPVSAKEFTHALCEFDVIIVTQEIIGSAIDCSILHRLNYWDALMIAAAEAGSCSILWTEDMQIDSTIRGVHVVNPFSH